MQKRSENTEREKTPDKEPSARIYIAVPYAEKDQAKQLGARWDRKAKSWYMSKDGKPELLKWKSDNAPTPDKAADPVAEFAQALKDHGIAIEGPPVMDGKWQRASLEGEPGKKNASYRAFLDGLPNAQVKNFKTGELHKWAAVGQPLSEKDRAALQAQSAETREVRKQELDQARNAAAKKAFGVWKNAHAWADKTNSDYLRTKDVNGYGIKVDETGRLLIPARDISGRIHSLQTIDENGKAWLKNSSKSGMMHVIDPNKEIADARRIVVAEGYATAATVHEATGHPVVVAFDSGNLKAVAETVRDEYPGTRIVIAADNDHQLEQNVGLTKANNAARAVGGKAIEPKFNGEERMKGLTDWNDMAQSRGKTVVAKLIKAALKTRQKGREQEMAR